MNIQSEQIGHEYHISVMGGLDAREDREHLISLLHSSFSPEGAFSEAHITFFETETLSADIIEALRAYRARAAHIPLKVFVFHKHLSAYLNRLGIHNKLVRGHYDYKFPIQELVSYISRHVPGEEIQVDEEVIKRFLADLHIRYGYDYQNYSLDSITRRLQKFMSDQGFASFPTFASQVLNDPELFEDLFLAFSINVTHFFRNPEVFRTIREHILPYLDTYAHIKIWCAGCSTGEEPYSLAILLDEYGILKKSQIYATDINPFVVAEAKNGLFTLQTLETNIHNYHDSGGTADFQDYFDQKYGFLKIQQRLRERILFFQHSLVNSGVLNEFQLILCRNVLIYFNRVLQQEVLTLFNHSLSRNGFLIFGESESPIIHDVDNRNTFEEYDKKHKIYRKRKLVAN